MILNCLSPSDLQYGYLELASGGTDYNKDRLLRLEQNGLNPKNFAEHLKVFDWDSSTCGLGTGI